MSSRTTTFQCPDTGVPVTCTYAFGRLRCDVDLYDPILDEEESIGPDTQQWIDEVHGNDKRGYRAYSVREAIQQLTKFGVDGYDAYELEWN